MIAMQYSFTLPADYDMTRIDERIKSKGHLLNGFPHLKCKAYLSAKRQDEAYSSQHNLYAPFYIWDDAEGASAFLASQGFEALKDSFGRPNTDIWLPLAHCVTDDVAKSQFATRHIAPIAPQTSLADLRKDMEEAVSTAIKRGATAAFAGFDPHTWHQIYFEMGQHLPAQRDEETQIYRVGYIAQ
nr:DUF4865 family protein [uncultured Cohaesibacter sp.]